MADDISWYRSFGFGSQARVDSRSPRPSPRPPSPQKRDPFERSFTVGPPTMFSQHGHLLIAELQAKADVLNVDSSRDTPLQRRPIPEPPQASVPRRAKSYTHVHRVARARRRTEDGHSRLGDQLKDERDFDDWFDGVSDELNERSHERFSLYSDQLKASRSHLDSLLAGTSAILDLLSSLTRSFKAVDVQASTFRSRCEGILAEQRRMNVLADNIGQNLQYYAPLEPITRRLNAPGAGHAVRRDDFSHMLINLDHCLDYMKNHPDHKEASAYESRYRLLLTRALTLIRVHFTNTLRDISADVSRRISERQLTDTTTSALLYAKFRVNAGELKRLGFEIHKRTLPPPGSESDAPGEYQSLLNELYQSYSAARGRLLVPLVHRKLADIAAAPKESKDLVVFARSSIGYIRGLCMDEYELWHEWFEGEGGLYEFLESMCEPLFDYLRPRTIHETSLPKLCEVCSIIQVRYMDQPDDDEEMSSRPGLEFSHLIRPALEDAQTRLVFLALATLRDKIERYKPTLSDLDCARRTNKTTMSGAKGTPALSGRKASANGAAPDLPKQAASQDGDAFDLQWQYDTAAYQEWYPTLRQAISLLSRIYRLVNSTVFDDLAHQIVHQTSISLQQAATQVAAKHSPTDSQIFLLKQLLTLKQQVIAFDIEYVTPEIHFDFSNVTNTFWELRERGGLFDPRNLVRLIGGGLMPRVVENMLDAKAELDGRLRAVINEFTNGYALRMTQPVSETARKKKGFEGPAAVDMLRRNIEREAPQLRLKLEEYLDDARIRETLVGAVQDQTLQNYEDFFDAVTAASNGTSVSKKGKSREDDVWDPDTLADWSNTVFEVDRIGQGLDFEEDGASPTLSRSNST